MGDKARKQQEALLQEHRKKQAQEDVEAAQKASEAAAKIASDPNAKVDLAGLKNDDADVDIDDI